MCSSDLSVANLSRFQDDVTLRSKTPDLVFDDSDSTGFGMYLDAGILQMRGSALPSGSLLNLNLNLDGGGSTVGGRVGIGTTMPNSKLHVAGTVTASSLVSGDVQASNTGTGVYSITTSSSIYIQAGGLKFPDGSIMYTGVGGGS